MKKLRTINYTPFDFHGTRTAWLALRDLAHTGRMFPAPAQYVVQAAARRRAVEWLYDEGLVERRPRGGPQLTELGESVVYRRSLPNAYSPREVGLIKTYRDKGWADALAERFGRTPAAIRQKYKSDLRKARQMSKGHADHGQP